MTTEDSASGHYRYNWTHFVDPATGEIVRTIALRPYYWFQAFAIFPDKHDAVLDLDDIEIDVSEGDRVIDLASLVTDEDNVDANILLSLQAAPALLSADATAEVAHAEVALEGKTLTVSPKSAGDHYFTLVAQSNGRTVSKTVAVHVGDVLTGIGAVASGRGSITCDGKRIRISGFTGHLFRIHDVAGRMVAEFAVDCDDYVFDFGSHDGIYVVSSDSNVSTKVVIRR